MSGVMGKFLVTGFVLGSVAACSSGSDDGKNLTAPKEMNTFSCQFTLTEGGTADYSALGTSKTARTYFEKEFNLNYLAAVYTSSVDETLRFVNLTGATVYKSELIPTNLCSSSLYTGAQTMPSDISDKWKSSNKDLPKGQVILGLYLPKKDSSLFPSLHKGAAIIVRENTNRWTLVHEFMHHLFMLRADETGYDDEGIRAEYSITKAIIENIFSDESLDDNKKSQKSALPFARFAKAQDTLLLHYFLEEITIEAILKDASSNGVLKYVPTEEGNWYIYESAKKALKLYEDISDVASQLLNYLPSSAVAERAAIADLKASIEKRKVTIAALTDRFPYTNESQGGVLLSGAAPSHVGCSHAEEGEKIMTISKKVTDKFKNLH